MRKVAIPLFMLVVLPFGRHARAAESAAALIEAVSRAASIATTWEADGRVITQESVGDAGSVTEASFRVVVERAPVERARLEIAGVPAAVTRVCDGSSEWGYLPSSRQYWKVDETRVGACAGPFDEWPRLAANLHEPVITGQERLHLGERFVECTVLRGIFVGPDAAHTGRRTLWIEEETNTIWQYTVERGAAGAVGAAQPAIQTYTMLHQARDGVLQPSDFAQIATEGWERLPQAPAGRGHFGEPPIYRVGNGTTAPIVRYKVSPSYTEKARKAGIEGTVILFVEIWPDGAAHNIRVVRPLDPGLDQKAIEAVEQWSFQPGTRNAVPVKVAATIEVNFKLVERRR
jgi:TonB family protein